MELKQLQTSIHTHCNHHFHQHSIDNHDDVDTMENLNMSSKLLFLNVEKIHDSHSHGIVSSSFSPYLRDLLLKRTSIRFCQRWTVKFKGTMQPVLFMIFFSDFVTPKKRTMSEGCWISYLKSDIAVFRHPIPQGFRLLLRPYIKVLTHSEKVGWWKSLMVECVSLFCLFIC